MVGFSSVLPVLPSLFAAFASDSCGDVYPQELGVSQSRRFVSMDDQTGQCALHACSSRQILTPSEQPTQRSMIRLDDELSWRCVSCVAVRERKQML